MKSCGSLFSSVLTLLFVSLGGASHLAAQLQPPPTTGEAVAQRFQWTGVGEGQNPFVAPLDFQKGRQMARVGPSDPNVELPPERWLRCVTQAAGALYNSTTGKHDILVTNPIAAFGSAASCPSLQVGKPYRFAFYPGALFGTVTGAADIADDIVIYAYDRSGFPLNILQTMQVPLTSGVTGDKIDLPHWPANTTVQSPEWKAYGDSGFSKTVTTSINGVPVLETTVQIVLTASPDQKWGALYQAPVLITHKALSAASSNYYFIVGAKGVAVKDSSAFPMLAGGYNSTLLGYAMNFDPVQPWETTLLQVPSFQGEPAPAAYYGKTTDEIKQANTVPRFTAQLPALVDNRLLALNSVPELRRHTVLDELVQKLSTPLAIANFVHNEIGLTDALSYNENGEVDEKSVNAGGMNRDALAVYQEGQGSPEEQCALLVYLLRQKGIHAGFVKPPHNAVKMSAQRLSNLLRMRIKDTRTPDGTVISDAMIAVNYPWVAAWLPSDPSDDTSPQTWVHFFPWLKDTEVKEGLSIEGFLPGGHKTIRSWVRSYLLDPSQANSPLLSLDPEDDTPGNIFFKHLEQSLGSSGSRTSDFGVVFRDRKHLHDVWEKFPQPEVITPVAEVATAYAVVPSLVADPSNPAPLDDLYDAVEIEIQPTASPGLIQPLKFRLRTMDFHNRKAVVNFVPGDTTGQFKLQFVIDHYDQRTAAADGSRTTPFTIGGFNPYALPFVGGSQPLLRSRQVFEMPVKAGEDGFTFKTTYYRHRRYHPSSTLAEDVTKNGGWNHFLGIENINIGVDRADVGVSSDTTFTTFRVGDMLAFCMNAGRVTDRMVQTHVRPYQQLIQDKGIGTATPSTLAEQEYDFMQSSLPYIMGMTYYQRFSDSAEQLKNLFKVNMVAMRAHGFAMLGVDRNAAGQALLGSFKLGTVSGNDVLINRFYQSKPIIDMTFVRSAWAGYGDLRADAGGQAEFSGADFLTNFLVTEISALEHHTIRQFYPQGNTDAISTVQLLHRMQKDQHAVATTDLGVSTIPTLIRLFAKTAGTAGNALKLNVSMAARGAGAAPGVTVDGNNINVVLNTTANSQSTVGDFVKAINETLASKDKVIAYFLQGVPETKVLSLPGTGQTLQVSFAGGAAKLAVLELDSSNWIEKGNTKVADPRDPLNAAAAKELKNWCGGSMWGAVESAFRVRVGTELVNLPDADLVRVFITQGDVTGANAQWKGMGALILGRGASAALIGNLNGGAGSRLNNVPITLIGVSNVLNVRTVTTGISFSEPPIKAATGGGHQVYQYTQVVTTTTLFNNEGGFTTFSIPTTQVSLSHQSPEFHTNVIPDYAWRFMGVDPSAISGQYYIATDFRPVGSTIGNVSVSSSTMSNSWAMPPASAPPPSANTVYRTASSVSSSQPPPSPPSWTPPLTYTAGPPPPSLLNSAPQFPFPGAPPLSINSGVPPHLASGGSIPQGLGAGSRTEGAGFPTRVSDPVNVMTGQFTDDVVDLVLPGRMPLALRRSYVSGAGVVSSLGHNWQPAYVAYMVPSDPLEGDSSGLPAKLHVANMDGSAIVYSHDTTVGNENHWIPTREGNPFLSNGSGAAMGSIHNPFENEIVRTVEGEMVTYTLTEANGSVRTYVERSYPVANTTPAITRKRPYLTRWSDHAGNYLDFIFEGNTNKTEYGELVTIKSSSGPSLGFFYDASARIVEARTGDGRSVTYEYDEYGDLVRVVLPDGGWTSYEYQHHQYPLNPSSPENERFFRWYSTHLIVQQTKPEGRILKNEYETYKVGDLDELNNPIQAGNFRIGQASHLGRVVKQYSTVGTHGGDVSALADAEKRNEPATESGVPVLNAIFEYHQARIDPGWVTGYTIVTDAYGRKTTFFYENTRITAINDPLTLVAGATPAETTNRKLIQGWYSEAHILSNVPGAYPGALAFIEERGSPRIEFYYYPNGNLKEQRMIGELDGNSQTTDDTASTFLAYNSDNLLSLVARPNAADGHAVTEAEFDDDFDPETDAPSLIGPLGSYTIYHHGHSTDKYLVTKTVTYEAAEGGDVVVSRSDISFVDVFSAVGNLAQPFAKAVVESQFSYAGAAGTTLIGKTVFGYNRLGAAGKDGRGFPTTITAHSLEAQGDFPDVAKQLTYNNRGELVEERLMDGTTAKKVFRYAYDDMGRPIWREQLGDEQGGGLRKQVAWSYLYYNLNGEPEWTDGSRSNPEDFTYTRYDAGGRVAETVAWRSRAKADGTGVEAVPGSALYATSKYGYNLFGDLVKVMDAKGDTTRIEYDAISRPILKKSYSGDPQDVAPAALESTSITYNDVGRTVTTVDTLGGVTEVLLTSLGKPMEQTNPDGTKLTWKYDFLGRATRVPVSSQTYQEIAYNDAGYKVTRTLKNASGSAMPNTVAEETIAQPGSRAAVTISALGLRSRTTYDALGRVMRVVSPVNTDNSDKADSRAVSHAYDATESILTATNALGEVTTVEFDALGRPENVAIAQPNTTGPPGSMTTASRTTYEYSPDFNKVTVTAGQGGGRPLVAETWTDTFGQTVLSKSAPGQTGEAWSMVEYDIVGNAIAIRDELGQVTRSTYDALGRVATSVLPDGGTTQFEYSVPSEDGGAKVMRVMPGGDLKEITLIDSFGRSVESFLLGADATDTNSPADNLKRRWTRGYVFYPHDDNTAGHFPGKLASFTDSLGQAHAFTYDSFGVPTGLTISNGSGTRLTRTSSYLHTQNTGTTTTLTETTAAVAASAATGTKAGTAAIPSVTTQVEVSTGLFGQLKSEKVFLGSEIVSHFTQGFDRVGRRTSLTRDTVNMPTTGTSTFGGGWSYGYHADGRLASTEWDSTRTTPSHTYTYNTNGLLTQRQNLFRTQVIGSRDNRGRILATAATLHGGTAAILTEALTWTGDSLQESYTATRSADDFSVPGFADVRNYAYSPQRRKLTEETWKAYAEIISPGVSPAPATRVPYTPARSTVYEFDGGSPGGLGIRTYAYSAPASPNGLFSVQGHGVSLTDNVADGLDSYRRVTKELSAMERLSLVAYGSARGAKSVSLHDGRWSDTAPAANKIEPVPDAPRTPLYHSPGIKAGEGNWQVPFSLPTGNYSLHASAEHPSGEATAKAQASIAFPLHVPLMSVQNAYDDEGQVTSRIIGDGMRSQGLVWDAVGRLIGVTQQETTGIGYQWTAVYDPLGRRIRTTWLPMLGLGTSAVPDAGGQVQQTSHYDPCVEFLEIGVHIKRGAGASAKQERWWKTHGPDLSGGYGGLHGIGGLEAVVHESSGRHIGLIDDAYGHVVAFAHRTGSAPATLEWNPARYSGYGPLPGHWAPSVEDGPVFYHTLGWRGRRVDATGFYHLGARAYEPASGRFLAPDPLGHASSMGLYDYAGGDPVNWVDPTGRMQALQNFMQNPNQAISSVASDMNHAIQGGNTPVDLDRWNRAPASGRTGLSPRDWEGLGSRLASYAGQSAAEYGAREDQHYENLKAYNDTFGERAKHLGQRMAGDSLSFAANDVLLGKALLGVETTLDFEHGNYDLRLISGTEQLKAQGWALAGWGAGKVVSKTAGALFSKADDFAAAGGGTGSAGNLSRNGSLPVQRQLASNTCGPNSVSMVLDTVVPDRLDTVLSKFNLVREGTLPDALVTALKANGVNAMSRSNLRISDIARVTAGRNPMIATVKIPDVGYHYVVVDGVTTRMGQSVVAIRDPGGSQYFEPVANFMARFTGWGVTLR